MKTKGRVHLLCREFLFCVTLFVLCCNENGVKSAESDRKNSNIGGRTKNNGRDRGIGYKRMLDPNAPTTIGPYPWPINSHPTFRYHFGKKMEQLKANVSEQEFEFQPDYYDQYDFEFAKSGINGVSFLKFYKEKQNKLISTRKKSN